MIGSVIARRIAFGLLAFGGTAVYAASFTGAERLEPLAPAAIAVGVAAGASWPIFGAMLLAASRLRPSVVEWADACLATMAAGMFFLLGAAAANVALRMGAVPGVDVWSIGWFHTGMLLAADTLMCVLFVRRAMRLGLGAGTAVALWIGGLNGTFAVILWLWLRGGRG